MTADKRVVFLLSSIERLTYMRVRVWGIWRSGKIYLWKFQRDQKSGQYVLLLSGAYRKTIQRARARFLHRTERKKNEKLIEAERNRRFIQNSPMRNRMFCKPQLVITNVRLVHCDDPYKLSFNCSESHF